MATDQATTRLVIRRMRRTDLDSVMFVENRAYEFGWRRATFRDSLKNDFECWVLVHQDAAELGSPLTIAHCVFGSVGDEAELYNLAVEPKYQGRGLGRVLLDHVIDRVQKQAVNTLYLEVRESNITAQNLYASRGFERVGRRKNYYRTTQSREDALVLALALKNVESGPRCTHGASPSGMDAIEVRA